MQVNSEDRADVRVGLRAFLRQDPDVIMVGEIRDNETAEIAITRVAHRSPGVLDHPHQRRRRRHHASRRHGDRAVPRGLVARRRARPAPRAPPVPRVPRAVPPDRGRAAQARHRSAGVLRRRACSIPPMRSKYTPPPKGMLYQARDGGCARCRKPGYTRPNRHLRAADDGRRRPPAGARRTPTRTRSSRRADRQGHGHAARRRRAQGPARASRRVEEVMLVTAEDKQ